LLYSILIYIVLGSSLELFSLLFPRSFQSEEVQSTFVADIRQALVSQSNASIAALTAAVQGLHAAMPHLAAPSGRFCPSDKSVPLQNYAILMPTPVSDLILAIPIAMC